MVFYIYIVMNKYINNGKVYNLNNDKEKKIILLYFFGKCFFIFVDIGF